jgi:mannuronan 5-epimerase
VINRNIKETKAIGESRVALAYLNAIRDLSLSYNTEKNILGHDWIKSSFMYAIKIVLIVTFGIYVNICADDSTESYFDKVYGSEDSCIKFDSKTRLISISCKSARISDIDKQLNNSSILKKESLDYTSNQFSSITGVQHKNDVWLLNAGIIIERNSTLTIDSTDTDWLKIVPVATVQLSSESKIKEQEPNNSISLQSNMSRISNDSNNNSNTYVSIPDLNTNYRNASINEQTETVIVTSKNNNNNPNGIHVLGSLKIDSVKITSWDPKKNDVIEFNLGKRPGEEGTKSEYDTVEPRPFIRVSNKASGTTNITNSELAYLGYSCSKCSGLSYYGGIGSLIGGNDIHHLLKGFYSNKMGYMIIENNSFHDNYLYGIDPHTGTHDMIIRGNNIHHNNATAVVCSKDCYNILIEGNEVHNNLDGHRGIAFSKNSDHSIARNNYVHDQDICIGLNRLSDYNKVQNNTLSNCNIGIDLTNTSNNIVSENKIVGARDALMVQDVTNKVFNNKIYNSTNGIVITLAPNHGDLNSTNNIAYYAGKVNISNVIKNTNNSLVFISNVVNTDGELEQADFENNIELTDDDD